MELEPVSSNGDVANLIGEATLEPSLSPDSPDISYVCGDPQADPRVGDEYQAEIPPMIPEAEHRHLLANPAESEISLDASHLFLVGLPVRVMWVNDKLKKEINEGWKPLDNQDDTIDINESLKSMKNKRSHTCAKKKVSKLKVEQLGAELNNKKESKPASVASRINPCQTGQTKNYRPLPGSLSDPWSNAEVDSFLLGLYVFGKNFIQIKNLIVDKDMGEILSFYYGEFYKSDKYQRWSNCRKTRNRKCVYGRKIFTGWRQQELISRLLPHVPEQLQNGFVEASKSLSEGSLSLEDYIYFLKLLVSVPILVEAVAIGKGKEDLTSLAMEPPKTKQVLCSEIPTGKACSSLTPSDIIKFLTGGFRLSKARCNDIFWEAVWPRLLARGWHSEQPKDQAHVSSNHYLVFLMPGVKKFSRRKLVKGDHYFDSISDILRKVASEPELLELEAEEFRLSSCNEVDGWASETLSEPDDPSDHRTSCYLKPRVSNCTSDLMKVTIVDSSLVSGGKSSKVTELRYVPLDFMTTTEPTQLENKGCFFVDSLDKSVVDDCAIPLNGKKCRTDSDHGKGKIDNPDRTKFTVVDTSLNHGGKSSRMRELRYSPIESRPAKRFLGENKRNSDYLLDVGATVNMPLNGDKNDSIFNLGEGVVDTDYSKDMALDLESRNNTLWSEDQNANSLDEDQANRAIKRQFSRRTKASQSINSAPSIKRRRLTACVKSEMSHTVETFPVNPELKQARRTSCTSNTPNTRNDYRVDISQVNMSATLSQSDGNAEEKGSGIVYSGDSFGMEMPNDSNEKHQPHPSIDLNLNHIPVDSGNIHPVEVDANGNQCTNSNAVCSSSTGNKVDPEAMKTSSNNNGAIEQQPNTNCRRQSTRNRPSTTRVLEALESGFYMERKQKSTEVKKRAAPFSNPSRRARTKLQPHTNAGTRSVDGNVGNRPDEAVNVQEDEVGEPLNKI